jgi:hypothetical protein
MGRRTYLIKGLCCPARLPQACSARELQCGIAGWWWHGETRLLASRRQRWLGQPALLACVIVCAWIRTYGMPTTGWA